MKAAEQGYCNALLDSQRLANAYGQRLLAQGKPDAADEMFRLSGELLALRKTMESHEPQDQP